jgi:hypothetical protein
MEPCQFRLVHETPINQIFHLKLRRTIPGKMYAHEKSLLIVSKIRTQNNELGRKVSGYLVSLDAKDLSNKSCRGASSSDSGQRRPWPGDVANRTARPVLQKCLETFLFRQPVPWMPISQTGLSDKRDGGYNQRHLHFIEPTLRQ